MTNEEKAKIKDRESTANIAQAVYKYLEALEQSRASRHTRWIWELLQNAHDAQPAPNSLIASSKYRPGKLVFLHNGSGFKTEQIYHLIFHGSTKFEDEETTGQYGSGFLTTHLLSSEIDVSGQLDDGKWFNFLLVRKPDSVDALRESMDQAWEDFNPSSSLQVRIPTPFTTRFVYPIIGAYAEKAVVEGIKTLEQCAPYVVAFNRNFARIEIDIDIKARCEHLCFKVLERIFLDEDRIQQITVVKGKSRVRKYLRAQGEVQGKKETSVAVPLESDGDGSVCLRVGETPRLFKDIPLVGTESFSFPAVINSFKFSPTEDRNEVRLGQSCTDPANIKNQAVIEEACGLLVHLLGHAASERWHHAHQWAEIPPIEHPVEQTRSWLRKCIKEKLIEKIRQTPVVLTEAGEAMAPEYAWLPLSENDEGVEELWDLLYDLQEYREKLPRRDEATGWCNTIKSWAVVFEDKPESLFSETMDGRKLASYIEEKTHKGSTFGKIEDLQGLLREDVSAVEWLNQLHNFFNENRLHDVGREYHIVMDQDGFLDRLSNLHCDRGIDEELKDIAEWLDRPIRQELRDTQLISLAEEVGAGEWKNADIVGDLINRLRERADKNPDDNFKEASVRLFAWIVKQKNWDLLRDFPMFAEEVDSDKLPVIYLSRITDESERPLAPVRAWSGDLQQFSELFPQRYILSDAFFELVPDLDVWQILDEQSFLKKNVIITKDLHFDTFLPDEPLPDTDETDHKTAEPITVTNIAFLTRADIGIMARVPESQRLARKFWRFLTEWLIVHDSKGLEIKKALCDCKKEHRYYPAEWLVPLVRNKWVPLGGRRTSQVMAKSLAGLIRGSNEKIISLCKNNEIVKLLKAIGIKPSDLMLEIVAEDAEVHATLERTITDMVATTGGNVSHLNHVRDYIEDLKNDEDLPNVLEKRRKQIKRVRENQDLGEQVEKLVEVNLKGKGFIVKRKPIGSDFEIEHDSVENDKEMGIELARGDQRWLVEVKATRSKEVRMTSTQAKTAVEEKNRFLLCVVPLDPGDTDPELDTVRAKMQFVKNIGSLVDQLCNDLNNLEEFREKITSEALSGVQLEVVSGTARIRVTNPVWENDGFPLVNLAEQLK